MEATILGIIGIIILLLIVSLIFKGIGFVLKIVTNPKFLLAALAVCVALFVISKLMG